MNNKCTHWWIIEPASGPYSRGVCKLCQEQRQFKNSSEPGSVWTEKQQERGLPGVRTGRRRRTPKVRKPLTLEQERIVDNNSSLG